MTSRRVLSHFAAFGAIALSAACSGGGGGGGGPAGPADEVLAGLPDAAIDSSSAAVTWATSASAPNAFGIGMGPALIATAGFDPACPIVTQAGNDTTVTGGCTDQSGNTYDGTISVKGSNYTYTAWKVSYTDTCGGVGFTNVSTFDGAVTLAGSAVTGASFAENVTAHATGMAMTTGTNCAATSVTYAVVYQGNLANTGPDADMDGTPDISVWKGSGQVGIDALGVVSASTTDENIDQNTCDSEALSGSTTVKSGTHTAVFTYDGTTDCNPNSTVTWTYDGADQGTLEGVSCDVGRTRGDAAVYLAIAGALVALVGFRRRSFSR